MPQMTTLRRNALLIALIVILPSLAQAKSKKKSGIVWEVGLNVGMTQFDGSYNSEAPVNKRFNYWNSDASMGGNFYAMAWIKPFIGLKFDFLSSTLSGEWNTANPFPPQYRGTPDPLAFETGMKQFSLSAVASIKNIVSPDADVPVDLLLEAGIGNINLVDKVSLLPLGDENNKRIVPLGITGRYALNEQLTLQAGYRYHIIQSDRVDGVHEVETDASGNVVRPYFGTQEFFSFTFVGIAYTINPGKKGTSRRKYHTTKAWSCDRR